MKNSKFKDTSYGSILKGEQRLQRSQNTWWYNGIILPVLTIMFSALDGVTLYPVFESIFAESPILLYVTTFGTALCLNFIPLIAARLYLKYKFGMGERNMSAFIICLAVFALIFIAVCALRIATKNAVIGNLSDSLSSSAGIDMSTDSVPGSLAMILVQCITNLTTSVIAFFLSYMSEDPLQLEINEIKQEIIRLEDRRNSLRSILPVFDNYSVEDDLHDEERKFSNAVAALNARKDRLKIESDLQLEMLCSDPDAVTYITSEGGNSMSSEDLDSGSDKIIKDS